MDIVLLSILLKSNQKENLNNTNTNTNTNTENSTSSDSNPSGALAGVGGLITSISSSVSNCVILIIAMVLSYQRNKDEPTSKKVLMLIFAFFLPFIYLIYHFVTRKSSTQV